MSHIFFVSNILWHLKWQWSQTHMFTQTAWWTQMYECIDVISSLKSHLSVCWKAISLTGYPQSPLFSHKARCGPRELQNGGRWPLAARASEISALLRSLNFLSDRLLDLQSLGTDEGVKMLVKTLFFYIAITLEAFIFCFAGEYLSNKVSIRNQKLFLFR